MALIECPECSREISDKAKSCPNCAYPVAETVKSNPVPSTSQPLQPKSKLGLGGGCLIIGGVVCTLTVLSIAIAGNPSDPSAQSRNGEKQKKIVSTRCSKPERAKFIRIVATRRSQKPGVRSTHGGKESVQLVMFQRTSYAL